MTGAMGLHSGSRECRERLAQCRRDLGCLLNLSSIQDKMTTAPATENEEAVSRDNRRSKPRAP